jgi:serine/threonine protein kinase
MGQADSSRRIEQLLQIEELRHRFETAWRAGEEPRLERYLEETERSRQAAVFFELLGVELQLRLERGEVLQAVSYHQRFPQYMQQVDAVFREAVPERVGQPTHLGPGHVLGDFRLVREIARGGMGVVYEAEQLSLGRPVALKVLPADQFEREDTRARFLREARAAATLHHTNIVPVLEVGEQDGTLFYAMQLIQGRPLQSLLAEMRRRRAAGGSEHSSAVTPATSTTPRRADGETSREHPPRDAAGERPSSPAATRCPSGETASGAPDAKGVSPLAPDAPYFTLAASSELSDYWRFVGRIGRQVAEGLHHAHEHGIVHRDVKPANLLVDTEGNAWITDFGLARVDDSDLTRKDEVIGTLRFLAPETLEGRSDARSDVYSLGLTLYELLSLRRPFSADDKRTLIQQVHASKIEPLSRVAPRVPRDLATIVAKTTHRDPRDRYQTARQLAEDLERFLRDEPILARRHSAAELTWRWIRHHPAVSSLAGVLLLLLTLVAIGSSVAAVQFHRSRTIQRRLADERETQRAAAAAAASAAQAAQQQVLMGLARLYCDQGLNHMEQGDYVRALLFTVQALAQLEEATANDHPAAGLTFEQSLRFRIAALLREVPTIVARRGFDEHDWTRVVFDRFVLSRNSNTPRLQYRPDGELAVVSKYGDVAFRWNVETDVARPVLVDLSSSPPTHGKQAGAVAEATSAVRFTRDARHAVRYAGSGELELWQCEPRRLVCRLESPPGDASTLLGCWITPDGRWVLVGSPVGSCRVTSLSGTRTPAVASTPSRSRYRAIPCRFRWMCGFRRTDAAPCCWAAARRSSSWRPPPFR